MLPAKRNLIVVIVCMNLDGFHGREDETQIPRIFIQYLIWIGRNGRSRWLDEPTFQQCCDVINEFPEREVKAVSCPCRYCRARGVKS